jgi:hypothetical protein
LVILIGDILARGDFMRVQKLTVHGYAEDVVDERRITFNPEHIISIIAGAEDVVVNNRSLRYVTVLFIDGGSVDAILNHGDLELIENAIGSVYTQ